MNCKLCSNFDPTTFYVPYNRENAEMWQTVGELAAKRGLCHLCYMACLPIHRNQMPALIHTFPDGRKLIYYHWLSVKVVTLEIDNQPQTTILSFFTVH